MNGEKILVKESGLGKLYIYWEEYNCKMMLHIRYWYTDKKDGVEKPGTKGIALPQHDLPNILEGLRKVLESQPK